MSTSGDNDIKSQSWSSTREIEAQRYIYDEDDIHRKKGINCQGAFQHDPKSREGSYVTETAKHTSLATNNSTESDLTMAVATEQMPQRPQDLIDKVSFGVVKVNVTSSAQYRKSYAFKIWRDQGFFPYRLTKEQLIKERRQKSKKQLNAIKIQQDRQNEEAWRAFKTTKSSNKEQRLQRKTPDQDEEEPYTVPDEEDATNVIHQSSIPRYFKTKKDATLQHNSKSIPTPVIHLINNPPKYMQSPTAHDLVIDHKHATTPNMVISNCYVEMSNKISLPISQVCSPEGNVKTLCQMFDQPSIENETTTSDTSKHYPINEMSTVSTEVESDVVAEHNDQESVDTNTATDSSKVGSKRQCKRSRNESSTALAEAQSETHSCTSDLVAAMKNSLGKKYCKENVKPDQTRRTRKRRRESNDGHTQGGKPTVFSQLDEKIATNLADGIHNVNSEYFPIGALANKAAKETSNTRQNGTSKVEEISKARLLLKELFDVTLESEEDHEMKTFDAASRSFGRKNILNHLSLLDRYFDEFQKKLAIEIS